jgi:hypothetical protein
MAHFMGIVRGARGEESRLGSKNSGMSTVAASWHGCIHVRLTHDEKTGKDGYVVTVGPWQGRGVESRVIAEGVFE